MLNIETACSYFREISLHGREKESQKQKQLGQLININPDKKCWQLA
jgi:hypothetical protein